MKIVLKKGKKNKKKILKKKTLKFFIFLGEISNKTTN